MPAPSPDQAFESFEREVDLIVGAGRTGAPTQDARSAFFGVPHAEFVDALSELRDEIEQRAYLAIVAAAEAVVQVDFRSRVDARASVLLRDKARELKRKEGQKRRIVLDAWSDMAGARQEPISEFRQMLHHRHWLAHGRYFVSRAGVSEDPGFAIARARALLAEVRRVDPAFPREMP